LIISNRLLFFLQKSLLTQCYPEPKRVVIGPQLLLHFSTFACIQRRDDYCAARFAEGVENQIYLLMKSGETCDLGWVFGKIKR
jgi:hypothetical protein